MTLSAQQLQAIEQGKTIELTIAGTHCVLLRQDVYQRDVYQQGASPQESSPREMYPAVVKAIDQFDESPEQEEIGDEENAARFVGRVLSPRLVHPEQAEDFRMEVREVPNAGI
jgi:hypothetical protein